MARLGTYHFCLADPSDRASKIHFKYVVHVLTEGEFTTTIPLNIAEEFESKGIPLARNKADNPGYFRSKTLKDLSEQISDKAKMYFSRELESEEEVIVYDLTSSISYCLKDGLTGDIVPNGGWVEKPNEYNWFFGTTGHQGYRGDKYGMNFFAKVYTKKTYRYIDDRRVIEYERSSYYDSVIVEESDPEYNMKFLASIPQMPGNYDEGMEIPFNERNASFFVNMFKTFAYLNEKILQFRDPQNLLELISSGGLLLGSPKSE